MELSNEDSLRLHVLLKNVEAIRIDEPSLTVYGLASQNGAAREAKVALNPNCRPEQYLRRVREFFSGAVLGSPGGYPLHLNRWTRMGQTKDGNLAELLMLGEPEAVAAVSGASGLTDDLARRVWWIAPTSENARRMLERESVARGAMGPILAQHLIDYLPFESESRVMFDTVRLVLQPGLIDDDARARLWAKGAKHPPYRVGFLQATPNALPHSGDARADLAEYRAALTDLAAAGNTTAATLLQALEAPGQAFIDSSRAILERPTDRDVVVTVLNLLGAYFQGARRGDPAARDIDHLVADAGVACAQRAECVAILHKTPALAAELRAILILSRVSEAVIIDVLAHTSATGTVLRKKLEPITQIVVAQLAQLTHGQRA